MGSPVIIDDGGSTRIKRMLRNGVGEMDGLLNVDDDLIPPQSAASVRDAFSNLKIACIDDDGDATMVLNSPLNSGDTLTVTSENGQKVKVDMTGTGCSITVAGTAGNAPQVEAKQYKRKRRYVVANAGPITKIEGVLSGVPFLVRSEDAQGNKFIYTSVAVV